MIAHNVSVNTQKDLQILFGLQKLFYLVFLKRLSNDLFGVNLTVTVLNSLI